MFQVTDGQAPESGPSQPDLVPLDEDTNNLDYNNSSAANNNDQNQPNNKAPYYNDYGDDGSAGSGYYDEHTGQYFEGGKSCLCVVQRKLSQS